MVKVRNSCAGMRGCFFVANFYVLVFKNDKKCKKMQKNAKKCKKLQKKFAYIKNLL